MFSFLEYNNLTSIPEGLIQGLSKLWLMYVLYSLYFEIETWAQFVFSRLDNNQLTSIPEGLTHGLSKLEVLYVEYLFSLV